MSGSTKTLEAAKEYLAMGFHPIAQRLDKTTWVRWGDFRETPPTQEHLDQWWRDHYDTNVALIMGKGVFALDFDGPKAELVAGEVFAEHGIEIPIDAPKVKTGNGFHVYLSTDEPIGFDHVDIFDTKATRGSAIDIKGVGLVTAPPSAHRNGATYKWIQPLTGEIPRAPKALIDLIKSRHDARAQASSVKVDGENWIADALTSGASEGGRDELATRLAGYFIGKNVDVETTSVILAETFGRNCNPPFPAREVEKCVRSVARRHASRPVDEDTGEKGIEVVSIQEAMDDLIQNLDKPAIARAPTPMKLLNWKLDGGFGPGELAYLAAKAGVGKTALALQFAKASAEGGFKTLIISAEMLVEALSRRMISQDSEVEASALKRRPIEDSDAARIVMSAGTLGQLPIWFTDRVQTLPELYDLVSKMVDEKGVGFLIVDYLQRIHDPKKSRDRRIEVEAVSSSLKAIAQEFKIPVLCLSGVSRSKEANQRPGMSSLRESGSLEHDADVVMILSREIHAADAELLIAKNRDGETGPVKLDFEGSNVKFTQSVFQ